MNIMNKRKILKFIFAYKTVLVAVVVMCVACLSIIVFVSVSPNVTQRNTIVRIEKNMTVTEAAQLLKSKGIIKFVSVYKTYVSIFHRNLGVQEGSYLFNEPQTALRIAYRTAYGVKNLEKIKLTIFEGSNSKEIASLIKKQIPTFDNIDFLARAKKYEGYLFPETYFVDSDVKPQEIIDMMRDQFNDSITALSPALASSTRSIEDIITMASIIEEEANNAKDRKIISGILWKRLDEGMPLQVDVPFYYIMDKGTTAVTLKDLATPSPYNLYLNKGLPPTPISNPGLSAIEAALYPTPSPYYFYLADRTGVTHYAKNHDGHVANKQKYLQ